SAPFRIASGESQSMPNCVRNESAAQDLKILTICCTCTQTSHQRRQCFGTPLFKHWVLLAAFTQDLSRAVDLWPSPFATSSIGLTEKARYETRSGPRDEASPSPRRPAGSAGRRPVRRSWGNRIRVSRPCRHWWYCCCPVHSDSREGLPG